MTDTKVRRYTMPQITDRLLAEGIYPGGTDDPEVWQRCYQFVRTRKARGDLGKPDGHTGKTPYWRPSTVERLLPKLHPKG